MEFINRSSSFRGNQTYQKLRYAGEETFARMYAAGISERQNRSDAFFTVSEKRAVPPASLCGEITDLIAF